MPNRRNRTVWERVEEALRDKGLPPTQKQAAQLAGIKQPSISKWTKPNKFPEMPTAVQLADKLGVCVQWLIDERGPKRPKDALPPDLGEIADFWLKLPLEVRSEVLGFAKYKRSITFTGDPEKRHEYQESIAQKEVRREDGK